MSADFLLRHFIGFALQVLPATVLLLLPFERTKYRFPYRRTWALFGFVIMILCAVYSVSARVVNISRQETMGAGFLFGNLFMCLSIVIIACLYFLLIRDQTMRKAFLFFSVVSFSAIQYTLANVLLSFFPLKPASQAGQSYDINTCIAYGLVTLVLLPPVAVFFRTSVRTYLKNMNAVSGRGEFILLITVTAFYLALNALLSMFWTQYQEIAHTNQSYYMPVIIMLTALLFIVYYSVIKLSNYRFEEEERKLEAAIMRADHEKIRMSMEEQRKRLHDTRQLLNHMSSIVQNSGRDELLDYIGQTLDHIHVTDERFCADSRMNGILQYYAAAARASGIGFTVRARCNDLSSISEIDLTVLLGNALENAIHAAAAWQAKHEPERAGITVTADDGENLLRIHIENSCAQVLYAPHVSRDGQDSFLPADSFLSIGGSGQGLNRISAIAAKYEGLALFCYDAENEKFLTWITLIICN